MQSRVASAPFLVWIVVVVGATLPIDVLGQEMELAVPAGMDAAQLEQLRRAGVRVPPQASQPADQEKKKDEEEKKSEDAKPDEIEKDESEGDAIKRPDKPVNVPDPDELEVTLDENGRVPPFSFAGHSWPDVLQWLANLSKQSLDWQELPKGYLNLSTRRSLSVEEVRDLINRTLHARGYTILVKDGVLSVFKLDKIDPSLIPKIDDELELYELPPHDFVKIALELPDGMDAAKAVEDIKQLLSPHHKIFPLVATSRVLVIDMVANLRQVSDVLNQERAAALKLDNIREFPLKYARADQVMDMVYVALGMDPKNQPTQMELAIKQQEMQLMMQLQQQGKDISQMMKEQPPVHLVFNRRHNSIIANAPPEEMRVIAETIRLLDVPRPGADDTDSENPAQATLASRLEVRKYPLVSMDPDSLKRVLEEIGNLHPFTELDTVAGSKILFAKATPEDHTTIEGMVGELDGTGRDFHIVRLRYKPAEVVAAGIYNLMVGEEKKDDDSDRYPYYIFRYGQEQNNQKSNEGFRVYADVDSNTLWLWANVSEMRAINEFLQELGELRTDRPTEQTVRTLDAFGAESTEELIERIKKAWAGKNEINVVAPPENQNEDDKPSGDKEEKPLPDRAAAHPTVSAQFAQFAPQADADTSRPQQPGEESASAEPPAPINITVTEDGRLVLSSTDAEAVDQLEALVTEMMPPPERFKRIRLKHIAASTMVSIMNDLFAEEMKDGEQRQTLDWWGRTIDVDQPQKTFHLSRRAKLMFDYDQHGNSLIVANATPRQMYEIERVVRIYDVPHEFDESLLLERRTEAIRIKYSKASVIAAAVKDAYRDLLSQHDQAFQSGNEENANRTTVRKTPVWSVIRYGGNGDGIPGSKSTERLPARFDGALAIGVDEIANVVVVSATEELFDSVSTLIRQLDEQAKPQTTVAVAQIGGNIQTDELQSTLAEILGRPWVGNRPDATAQQAQAGGRRDRDEQRRREWRQRRQNRR